MEVIVGFIATAAWFLVFCVWAVDKAGDYACHDFED